MEKLTYLLSYCGEYSHISSHVMEKLTYLLSYCGESSHISSHCVEEQSL